MFLSVILIVRDPSETPDNVLTALAGQEKLSALSAEIEIMVIDGRPDVERACFDGPYGNKDYVLAPGENMPKLKAIGIDKSRGQMVAFLEPKGIPAPSWLAAVFAASQAHPSCAIGGAVNFDGIDDSANRAAFIFEYSAFSTEQLQNGNTNELPGNNMALPRALLAKYCSDILAREGLNKPFCQQRLKSAGIDIFMAPEMEISLCTAYTLKLFLRRRFSYARCYGSARIRTIPTFHRLALRIGAPLIPAVLLFRHLAAARKTALGRPRFGDIAALLAICLVWSFGEIAGYWFDRGKACARLY